MKAFLSVVAAGVLAGGPATASELDTCGTLIQWNQCVLFSASDGDVYQLDEHGPFGVGHRVHVVGEFQLTCFSNCLDGVVCVDVSTIESCGPSVWLGCGTLVQGFECILLDADADGLWVLDDAGGFDVGDRVEVTAYQSPDCPPFCEGLAGCLAVQGVVACCPGDTNGDGMVDLADLFNVVAAWGSADTGADLDQDGAVTVDDLIRVVLSWGACE